MRGALRQAPQRVEDREQRDVGFQPFPGSCAPQVRCPQQSILLPRQFRVVGHQAGQVVDGVGPLGVLPVDQQRLRPQQVRDAQVAVVQDRGGPGRPDACRQACRRA